MKSFSFPMMALGLDGLHSTDNASDKKGERAMVYGECKLLPLPMTPWNLGSTRRT